MKKIVLLALLLGVYLPSHAQTIGSQYNTLLADKCARLGFARDAGGQMAAGQAGGRLLGFCNGLSTPSDPLVNVPANLWDDPIQSMESEATERITSLPGWRDRTIRQRVSRRALRSGQQPMESQSDFSVFVGMRPGIVLTDEGDYERGHEDSVNFVPVLGVNYWVNDAMLLNVTGGYRSRGYTAGTSVVWTRNEKAFAELRSNFDSTALRIEREFAEPTAPGSVPDSYLYTPRATTSAKPRVKTWKVELHTGYDASLGSFLLGPRIGVRYRSSDVAGYSERTTSLADSAFPLALAFDADTVDSLTHTIGIAAAFKSKRGRVVGPQVEMSWVHEYRDVQRTVTARFAEDMRMDPTRFSFLGEERARDNIRGRLGVGVDVSSRLMIFATGEARYEDRIFEMSGIVGLRCKL